MSESIGRTVLGFNVIGKATSSCLTFVALLHFEHFVQFSLFHCEHDNYDPIITNLYWSL